MKRSEDAETYLAKPDVHESWKYDYLAPEIENTYETIFQRIIERLGAKPGDAVLDAGCGYCHHAARLARAGLDVTGLDFSPSALAQAQSYLDQEKLSITLRQGSLLDLPFEKESFPFIVCWGVLMHIPDVEVALGEMARVLKCGGRIAIAENNQLSLHVRVLEPAIRLAKKALGRSVPERLLTPCGIEEWKTEGLMIRKLNFAWLEAFYAFRGLRRIDHFAGQFSEIYTNLPRPLKSSAYRFNQLWVDNNLSPRLALGNIAIFEKV